MYRVIRLRKSCLSSIFNYPIVSNFYHSNFRFAICNSFWRDARLFLKSNYNTASTNGRFNEANREKVNYLETENGILVEKYLEKLDSKMKNFDNISKKEFENVLASVKADGCSEKQSCLLLQCCAHLLPYSSSAEQTELILSTWEILKNNCSISLECYHVLLLLLANLQNENVINTENLLTEIEERGLFPSEKTYFRLLYYACSIGDVSQVTYVISRMKDAGVSLNETHFNYIILCHGQTGNLDEAENALQLMSNSCIQPTSETYTILMKAAAKNGNQEKFGLFFSEYCKEISDIQRLKIVESLSAGKLYNEIPKVLGSGAWKNSVDLTNAIIQTCRKLVYCGSTDSAVIIFESLLPKYIKNMSDPDNESTCGLFFIQDVVKSNVPVQTIIKICDKLSPYNSYALYRATEAALISRMQTIAIQLLQTLSERGHQLRPHYFWPILTYVGNTKGERGVLDMLDTMIKLGVKPDRETLTEWICNHCNLSKSVELVRKFQDKGLPTNMSLTAVVQTLLFQNNLKEAAALCRKFKSNLDWDKEKLLKLLSLKLLETGDIDSIMTILSLVKDKNAGDDVINFMLSQHRVSLEFDLLSRFIQNLKKSHFILTEQLLDRVDSMCKGKRINNTYGSNGRPYIPHPKNMNINELEEHLLELKSKKMNTRGVLRRLLQEHCRLGNSQRVLQIKEELEGSGLKFSAGMLASLFETFAKAGLLEDAKKCLDNIKNNHPYFKLDTYKVIDFATANVKNGLFQGAVDVLKQQDHVMADESFLRNCCELLNAVAEKEGSDKTKTMFDLLIEKNYCTVNNKLLGPLIRSHLLRENFIAAVDIFEVSSLKYNCTPLQHELLCALFTKESEEIGDNDNDNEKRKKENTYSELIKRIIDSGIKVHGKRSTDIAVIVALAECALVNKLKIFILDLHNLNSEILLQRCNRLADENKPEVLLRIINALKDFPFVKIENLYNTLLKVYVRRNDCDGALSLWTTLQEENVVISEEFLKDLALLLTSNKKNIPFAVPNIKAVENVPKR